MLHHLSPTIVAEPPFRSPYLYVFSKGKFVPMDHPSVDTNNRARLKPFSTYLCAFGWNHPFQGQPERRMNASGFLDAGIQVWQIPSLLPSHRIRKPVFAGGLLQLGQKPSKGLWMF